MRTSFKKTIHWFCAIAGLSGLTLSHSTIANETTVCSYNGSERKINLIYDSPTQTTPCSVTYEKDGDEVKTLWRAESQEGYCETKVAEFIEKQQSWGWDCAALDL